jgi:transposase
LVAWRSGVKASVHAVLAKQGVHLRVSDLFGVAGRQLLAQAPLDAAYRLRVNALVRLLDALDFEIRAVAGPLRAALTGHPGFQPMRAVPGVGPVLAAVFVAEIGEVRRFADATHLSSWAGLTPKHRESDTVVRRGPITKQGSTLVRWAAVEAAHGADHAGWLSEKRSAIAGRRGRNVATVAWPAGCSPSSTTAYATGTSAPSTGPGRRREQART